MKPHDCKTELRNASLKATTARLAVLRILEKSDKPLSAAMPEVAVIAEVVVIAEVAVIAVIYG